MPERGDFEAFVPAGLASLGIEADEAELGVMQAAYELYWPATVALLDLDLSGVEPEPGADLSAELSQAPEPA